MSGQPAAYAALMLFGVLISSVAQVMLKKAAEKEYDSFWKEYLNPRVIGAYMLFFGATFLSIFAYRVVPLSMGPILESTGYLYVTLLSVLFFHEKVNGRKLIALGLIIGGIVVYTLAG